MTKTVLGIIGDSGVCDIAGLENAQWKTIETPWDTPSDALLSGAFKGVDLVFPPRHLAQPLCMDGHAPTFACRPM